MVKKINEYKFPEDLKYLSDKELSLLAYDIRDFLVEKVSSTGGHLASNLGIVELTIALHKVFDSPEDKILWDVGHQSYVHKILTGRANQFDTLRQLNGMSGFPKREESPHDVFNSGHSSNSISIALGIAKARDLMGKNFAVVDIIGDGALTGGIAYEALNNAGNEKTKILIIVNDNQMSISENTGAVSRHLSQLRSTHVYNSLKKGIRKSLLKIPSVGNSIYEGLEHLKDTFKYAIFSGSFFEELGFKYYGPVDGHNISELISILEFVKEMDEPVVLHVVTKKGKGISQTEDNPNRFHGVGPFDTSTFEPLKTEKPSYSRISGNKITSLAEKNPKIVAITAAMTDGTGLIPMCEKFPDRLFDVGIAEQHAVSFAAGMALQGMKPFVVIYSTFLQRSYDQIISDVCLQNLPVVFCIDRAGIVGADGETHHGVFDLSYLLHMPNLTVMAAKDGTELEAMLEYASALKGPCAIRYPRGAAEDYSQISSDYHIDGAAEVMLEGSDVILIAIGKMVGTALIVAENLKEFGVSATVINSRFAKPIDEKTILQHSENKKIVVTLEDNTIINGFGSSVLDVLEKNNSGYGEFLEIGWPDKFIPQGSSKQLEEIYGLDSKSVIDRIKGLLSGDLK